MITDSEQIQRIETCFPFLFQPQGELSGLLLQRGNLVRLPRGGTICHQGMQCSHLALVLAGVARVFKLAESGREITLYRIARGQSCILTASCIISASPFPAVAVCEEALEAVVVPAGEVERWLNEFPVWRRYLFGMISERLSDVITVVEEVAFQRVDRRIAAYLLTHADPPGQVRATHQEIASELGTSREVVSRILKDLENQGCISVGRGLVCITGRSRLEGRAAET